MRRLQQKWCSIAVSSALVAMVGAAQAASLDSAAVAKSDSPPLQAFARRLAPYVQGIVAHCRWPMGTNLVEGINNRIKVIKRVAYGFRDDAYFFLKIRAAFPGLG
jgi:transposase